MGSWIILPLLNIYRFHSDEDHSCSFARILYIRHMPLVTDNSEHCADASILRY